MRIDKSPVPTPALPPRSPQGAASVRVQPTDAAHEGRTREVAQTPVPVSSAAMSFDINPASNSITVTISDRITGEVLRQLVYDHGAPSRPTARSSGRLIDLTT